MVKTIRYILLFISLNFSICTYGQNAFLQLAYDYAIKGSKDDALRCVMQANDLQTYKAGSADYITLKFQSAYILDVLGYWDECLSVLFDLEPYQESINQDINIAININIIYGDCYSQKGDYYKAYYHYNKIDDLSKDNDDLSYYNLICNIFSGVALYGMGDYDKAIQRLNYAYEHINVILNLPNNESIIATCYYGLGSTYSVIGEHSKALKFALEGEKYIKENHLEGTISDYQISLLLGNLECMISEADLANTSEPYLLKALNIAENLFGKISPQYLIALRQYAVSLNMHKDYDTALDILKNGYQICKNSHYASSALTIEYLNAFTTICTNAGKFEEADIYLKDYYNLLIAQENVPPASVYKFCMAFLNNWAFSGQEKTAEAIGLVENIYDSYCGSGGYLENILTRQLALCSGHVRLFDEGIKYVITTLDYFNNEIFNKLVYLSRNKRKQILDFWGSSNIWANYIEAKDNEKFSSKLLEFELNRRSLQLNIDREINALLNSKEELKQYGQEMSDITGRLLKETDLSTQEKQILTNKLAALEQNMLISNPWLGEYLDSYSSNFTSLVNRLNATDLLVVMIEFDQIAEEYEYSKALLTLILKKGWTSPKSFLINHVEYAHLIEQDFRQAESYEYLKDILINKIKEHIEGIENIYLCPSGVFTKIPFEAYQLLIAQDDVIYNVYRISSPRELLSERTIIPIESVVLYGGLNYNASFNDLAVVNYNYHSNTLPETNLSDITRLSSLSSRGTQKYLEGTKVEVDSICELLKSRSIPFIEHKWNDGTEESFYNLNGKKISVVHIATHGFYYNDDDIEEIGDNRSKYKFIIFDDETPYNVEDRSMTRTGLIMSGANNALRGDSRPDNISDGILTANEISSLKLENVDFVVLSACQTGLGKTSGEGVYGLQRGFKMAGAKSLLMSLWEVDDNATMVLMTEFYRNLLNGNSKIASLKSAQEYVKESPGWESPQYWAGWILLDALN